MSSLPSLVACVRVFAPFMLAAAVQAAAPAPTPSAARPPDSALFREFANSKHRGEGTVLPDYSYAGYHLSAKPLPTITREAYQLFNVCDFGAVPNDERSDRDAVLKAVAAAEASPGAALVFFPAGRFLLNEKSDVGKPAITISRGNIVLKGAGMAETELFFNEPSLNSGSLLTFREPTRDTITDPVRLNDYSIRGFRLSKVTSFPERGVFSLQLEDASTVRPGMVVTINALMDFNTEAGKRYFAPHEVPEGCVELGQSKYLFEVHRVKAVEGNTVTFVEPIQFDLPNYSGAVLYETKVIEEVGLEHLTLSGNNRELFFHHAGSRTDPGFFLLSFRDVLNGWVRSVRFRNYGNALHVNRGGFNTFMNLVYEGNAGHLLAGTYAGSYGNLFLYNRELAPTWHGPIGDGGATTVAQRSQYFGNMEMHCRGSRSSLLDACQGEFAFLRGGGRKFFPHQGKYNCFWNWQNTKAGKVDFWPVGSTYGYMMPPIVVGLHGEPCEIADLKTDTLATESLGTKVSPESLLEAQLALRLGSVPAWLTEAARRYETISRFSTVQINAPASHTVLKAGQPFPVSFGLDPRLNLKDVRKIQLKASRTSLDSGYQVIKELTQAPFDQTITLPAPGTWSVVATLTNSLGEICESLPVIVYLDDGRPWQKAAIVSAVSYVETGELTRAAMELGLHVDGRDNLLNKMRADNPGLTQPELDSKFAAASVAAYESAVPLMQQEHAAGDNPQVAALLMDGDSKAPIQRKVAYKGSFHFDLGTAREVSRLVLVFAADFAKTPYKLELMGSNDERAWFTFLNDEEFWEPALVRNGQCRIAFPVSTQNKRLSFYLPARKYRYYRLIAPAARLNTLTEVEFYGK
jgi:hypothetical protein